MTEPSKKIVPKIVPVLKDSIKEFIEPTKPESITDGGIKKIKSHLGKSQQPEIDYTVKISIPSLSDLHREIYTQIQSNVYNIVGETLASISKDTGMSLEKLQETYLNPLKIIMDTNMEQLDKAPTVKKTKKSLDITELCLARTSAGIQCSRKRQINMEFCGSHLTTQPYGRIDQAVPEDKILRKRGRPPNLKTSENSNLKAGGNHHNDSNLKTSDIKGNSKQVFHSVMEQMNETPNETEAVDKDEIIQVKFEIKEINDMTYIVDENGNIYEPPPTDPDIPDQGVLDIEDLVQVGQELSDGTYLWL